MTHTQADFQRALAAIDFQKWGYYVSEPGMGSAGAYHASEKTEVTDIIRSALSMAASQEGKCITCGVVPVRTFQKCMGCQINNIIAAEGKV